MICNKESKKFQPVKRITEYPILLEKLLKHTRYLETDVVKDHPDRENIDEALQIAKRVCDQVKLNFY